MDENLTKFSFLFDRNIDEIVSTLPPNPVNGQAFFLTTDNRMYFRVESTWYSTPTPKWFEFQIRSTGVVYRFDGTSISVVESPSSFDSRIDTLEVTVSGLGTAAFEDSGFFATQAELDVVEAHSQSYTDALVAAAEERFEQELSAAGYTSLGSYAAGLSVVSLKQYFRRDGRFYRAAASLDLPYTLTGTWATDAAYLVLLGDDVLRQELAAPAGAGLIGLTDGMTVADLIDTDALNKGAALVGYRGRTVHARLGDTASVKDFGAMGDGVTDDTAAIQYAIAATQGQLRVPAGRYRLTGGISWTKSDLYLVGEGEGATTLICEFAEGDIIAIGDGVANPNNSGVFDLSINSTVQKTSGAAIRFRNGHNLRSRGVRIDGNMFVGFQFDGGPQQFLYYLEDWEVNSGTEAGVALGLDGTLPQDVWISDGIAFGCKDGVLLKHCSGVYMRELDLLGCDSGVVSFPGVGERVVAIWGDTVIADTCNSHGWKILTDGGLVAEWTLTGSWGASCGVTDNGSGVYLNPGAGTISGVSLTAQRCINNKGNGIHIVGGSQISIVNPQIFNNSTAGSGLFHGVAIDPGVSNWSIAGGVIGAGGLFSTNNQSFGIMINAGASNFYSVSNVNVTGNVSGGISDGGTGGEKHITHNLGYRTSYRGSGAINAGSSGVVIQHGLSSTPQQVDIILSPTVNLSSAGGIADMGKRSYGDDIYGEFECRRN